MAQRVRVQSFTVSQDGYGTGEGKPSSGPFGHADPTELMAWRFDTASWPGAPGPADLVASTTTSSVTSPSGSAPRSWVATSSAPAVRGPTTSGRAGGVTLHRSTHRCSCSPTTSGHRSHSLTLRSTSSTLHQSRPSTSLKVAAGDSTFVGGGLRPSGRLSRQGLSTSSTSSSLRSRSAAGPTVGIPEEFDDRFHHETIPSPSGVTHHLLWRNDPKTGQDQ